MATIQRIIVLLVLPVTCLAMTHHVYPDGSGDFPTIQAAVDAASGGCGGPRYLPFAFLGQGRHLQNSNNMTNPIWGGIVAGTTQDAARAA